MLALKFWPLNLRRHALLARLTDRPRTTDAPCAAAVTVRQDAPAAVRPHERSPLAPTSFLPSLR